MSLPDLRYSDVADAFDAIAPQFAGVYENETTVRLRERVYATIVSVVPRGSSILDINCGTGIDAWALSQAGFSVTGADLSPGMLAEARRRRDRDTVAPEFVQCSFDDLSPLKGRLYDLVLSNFGGLNCVGAVAPVLAQVAAVVRPGRYFFAVVMPAFSLWEIMAGLLRFSPSQAFRRFSKSVQATGFAGRTFPVFYHPLRGFLKEGAEWFEPISVRGAWVISPPPHAKSFRRRFPHLSDTLDQLEERIATLPGIRGMGDHYAVLLRRKQ